MPGSDDDREDLWQDNDVDYFGYGEDPPEYFIAPPPQITDWKTDRDARQAAEDAEVARRVAAHPGYDDDAFFERQTERAKEPYPPGTHCERHLRSLGLNEKDLQGRPVCTWCHPEFHALREAAKAPRSQSKKDMAAWRKAQQAQEDLEELKRKPDVNREATEAYLHPGGPTRYCLDCATPLNPGQQYRCEPCVIDAYAEIPEKYRDVLPTPPDKRAAIHAAWGRS